MLQHYLVVYILLKGVYFSRILEENMQNFNFIYSSNPNRITTALKAITTRGIQSHNSNKDETCKKDHLQQLKSIVDSLIQESYKSFISETTKIIDPSEQNKHESLQFAVKEAHSHILQMKKVLKLIIKSTQESMNHSGTSYFYNENHYGSIESKEAIALCDKFLIHKDAKSHLESICAHRNTIFKNRKFSFYKTNYTNTAKELIKFIENIDLNFSVNEGNINTYQCPDFLELKKLGYSAIEAKLNDSWENAWKTAKKEYNTSEMKMETNGYQLGIGRMGKLSLDVPEENIKDIWMKTVSFLRKKRDFFAVLNLNDSKKFKLDIYFVDVLGKESSGVGTLQNFADKLVEHEIVSNKGREQVELRMQIDHTYGQEAHSLYDPWNPRNITKWTEPIPIKEGISTWNGNKMGLKGGLTENLYDK